MDASESTRLVIDAISKGISGVLDPSLRYNPTKKKLETNYVFCTGQIVSGVFSKSTSLSQITLDNIIRNAIISKLDVSIQQLRRVICNINKFASDFGLDRFNGTERQVPSQHKALSILREQVNGLKREIERISSFVSHSLSSQNVENAFIRASTLPLHTSSLSDFVSSQLRVLEDELLCCFLNIERKEPLWTPLEIYSLSFYFLSVFLIFSALYLYRRVYSPK